jgi:hypothetical protein
LFLYKRLIPTQDGRILHHVVLLLNKLIAEPRFAHFRFCVFIKLRSEGYFFLKQCLKLWVLSQFVAFLSQLNQTWQTDIVPVDVIEERRDLSLSYLLVEMPIKEHLHHFVFRENLEPLVLEYDLELFSTKKTRLRLVNEQIKVATYCVQNNRHELLDFDSNLDFKTLACFHFLLDVIFNHEAVYFLNYRRSLVADDDGVYLRRLDFILAYLNSAEKADESVNWIKFHRVFNFVSQLL